MHCYINVRRHARMVCWCVCVFVCVSQLSELLWPANAEMIRNVCSKMDGDDDDGKITKSGLNKLSSECV